MRSDTVKYRLDLKPEPDGYGYIYGQLYVGDMRYYVNIMPPIREWRGQIKLEGDSTPHTTDWVIFVNGEEFARVRKRDDIEEALTRSLNKPSR